MTAHDTRGRRGTCVAMMWLSFTVIHVAEAQTVSFRAFADAGAMALSASQSFEAVSGSRTGLVVGGGVDVLLRPTIAVTARVARLRKEGERVFVFNGETFPLGIPSTITLTPLEVGAAYRFPNARSRLTPYVGGGIGWHRYSETSDFAEANESVQETFTGYHVLGGAEFRMLGWLSASGEAQWTSIPNALGGDPNGVAAEFGERDLGGTSFRVRLIVGR
jgi:hypothetical protein